MSSAWNLFLGIALAMLLCAGPVRSQAPSAPGSSLPALQTAAVSSVGYADLTYAAEEVYKTIPNGVTTIVIYDSQSFAQLASYEAVLSQIKLVRLKLCEADQLHLNAPPPVSALSLSDLSGLTGVAGLIQVFVPTYNNASANLAIPTPALVAALVNTVKASKPSIQIIVPSYVLPSVNVHPIPCSDASWKDDKSFTDQWAAASGTADSLHRKLNETPAINADVKKALEDALKVYDDMYKALTASDKGDPLLPHVLAEENLSAILNADTAKLAVLDLQLDLVGADSVTRVWLGFIKTVFSADVLARYYWFTPDASTPTNPLVLVAAGTVDILSENIDIGDFAKSKSFPHRVLQTKSPMPQ